MLGPTTRKGLTTEQHRGKKNTLFDLHCTVEETRNIANKNETLPFRFVAFQIIESSPTVQRENGLTKNGKHDPVEHR